MICSFCGKDLCKESNFNIIYDNKGNKKLAYLCENCYNKYIMLLYNESIIGEEVEYYGYS